MPRFVFRPQVVLDLRRRQADEARRALDRAVGAVTAAEADLQRALDTRQGALARGRDVLREAHEISPVIWHETWVRALQVEVVRRRDALAAARAGVGSARHAANRAHQALRAFERLRARAWHAYQIDERRAEQKDLDWLGTLSRIQRQIDQKEDP